MNTLLKALMALAMLGMAQAQNGAVIAHASTTAASPQVLASAQKATQKLGNEVLKGNYLNAYNLMYERMRKREEKRHGKVQFMKQFTQIPQLLLDKGITIQSFKAQQPISAYRVWPQVKPAIKRRIAAGENVALDQNAYVYSTMVVVPTTQVWAFASSGGKVRKLLREGFQIAVAPEGTEEWKFIDGSSLGRTSAIKDLRDFFPTLPLDVLLPERRDQEIK